MMLKDVKSPDNLKELSIKELNTLASEIREFLIDNLSKTGGHMSSNLGIVEMTIALHYVFNSPYDKFIFDVGHQSYVHKILTGRLDKFDSLRKKNGLSGFINYNESNHDVWEAGHSSTSLSAASGFLEAKEAGKDIGEVITIIGDGSIPNGLSFEALNYLGAKTNQKSIIILNDNDMSISKNVGKLAKTMSKIRIKKSYSLFKRLTPKFIHRHFYKLKVAMRSYVYQPTFFSSLGFKYYGPIDGHNIEDLIKFFMFAKKTKSSVLLHVKTIKGKGYPFSELDTTGIWHGVGPFDIKTGNSLNNNHIDYVNWGEGICQLLVDLYNDKVRVITPAMISGSNLRGFQEKYPNSLIDVGIAEEHAVVMAGAMARNGLIPVVSIYSTFLQRAYDQLNHDVCRSNNHVIFLVDRAGITGGDGSTHQGIFDISFMTALPNIVISMPRNLSEAKGLLKLALLENKPFVIRYPKSNVLNTVEDVNISLGTWEELYPISDINILTYGDQLDKYILKLKDKDCGLINGRFIKPIDEVILKKLSNKKLIIIEEVVRNGSLASLILDYNNRYKLNIEIESYAIDDLFIDSGSIDELRKELKLDVDSILEKI